MNTRNKVISNAIDALEIARVLIMLDGKDTDMIERAIRDLVMNETECDKRKSFLSRLLDKLEDGYVSLGLINDNYHDSLKKDILAAETVLQDLMFGKDENRQVKEDEEY